MIESVTQHCEAWLSTQHSDYPASLLSNFIHSGHSTGRDVTVKWLTVDLSAVYLMKSITVVNSPTEARMYEARMYEALMYEARIM